MLWKSSKLEKRIRDIERERSRLDHEIKSLSRHLDKRHTALNLLRDGGDDMDTSRSARPYVDGTARRSIGPRIERADFSPPGDAGGGPAGVGPYFSGGPAPKSLRRERHLQRNKAIFMLIVVIVVAIILYRIVF